MHPHHLQHDQLLPPPPTPTRAMGLLAYASLLPLTPSLTHRIASHTFRHLVKMCVLPPRKCMRNASIGFCLWVCRFLDPLCRVHGPAPTCTLTILLCLFHSPHTADSASAPRPVCAHTSTSLLPWLWAYPHIAMAFPTPFNSRWYMALDSATLLLHQNIHSAVFPENLSGSSACNIWPLSVHNLPNRVIFLHMPAKGPELRLQCLLSPARVGSPLMPSLDPVLEPLSLT